MTGYRLEVLEKGKWHCGLVPFDRDDMSRMIEWYRHSGKTIRILKDVEGEYLPSVIVTPYPQSNDKIRESGDE